MWKYLNNRTVHFNGSQASETEDPEVSEGEEDKSKSENNTTKVNELL
jgi:hypothetical protein